ncbi:Uma2 family endonuclease [Sphaerothrix gracilis]|uniref:Uma2 family endonuclease n=1 Tax=Sphaerothrix gracilis TaxID=3151835 RepID=UPI0031FDE797
MVPITRKPILEQVDPPRSPRETLPTMYDLPSEYPEEPGLPDEFHDLQPQLLSRTLRLDNYARDRYFTASDLNLYYDVNQPLWHKRPDWFLAVDVPRLYDGSDLRRSYVVWQEGKNPYVVVEFLSPGTAAEDLGRFSDKNTARNETAGAALSSISNGSDTTTANQPPAKLEVYEQYLRIPHYLVYSRYTQQLRYFQLAGGRYQEQILQPENPLVWLADLEIGLGLWSGEFEGIPGAWLRWCDRAGNWFLTDTEQAQQAQAEAQAQLLQAAQNLLATGMTREQVVQLLNLSAEQARSLPSGKS